MTKYEKIKSMSVEELAQMIADDMDCVDCMFAYDDCEKNEYGDCFAMWLNWLNSEAEE